MTLFVNECYVRSDSCCVHFAKGTKHFRLRALKAGFLFFVVIVLAATQMLPRSTSASCGTSVCVADVVAFLVYGKRTKKCDTLMSRIVLIQSRPLDGAFAG